MKNNFLLISVFVNGIACGGEAMRHDGAIDPALGDIDPVHYPEVPIISELPDSSTAGRGGSSSAGTGSVSGGAGGSSAGQSTGGVAGSDGIDRSACGLPLGSGCLIEPDDARLCTGDSTCVCEDGAKAMETCVEQDGQSFVRCSCPVSGGGGEGGTNGVPNE